MALYRSGHGKDRIHIPLTVSRVAYSVPTLLLACVLLRGRNHTVVEKSAQLRGVIDGTYFSDEVSEIFGDVLCSRKMEAPVSYPGQTVGEFMID